MAKPLVEGPAQLKKPDFSRFVAGKLGGRTCGWLCGNENKNMAFVPASGLAEHPDGQAKLGANVPASGKAKCVK